MFNNKFHSVIERLNTTNAGLLHMAIFWLYSNFVKSWTEIFSDTENSGLHKLESSKIPLSIPVW